MTLLFRSKAVWILAIVISLIGGLSTAATAGPLFMVTLESRTQAAVAEKILETAHVRIGNQFLVSANPVQQALLTSQGLTPAPVMTEFDGRDVYLIRSLEHPKAPELIDLKRLGEPVDLGRGFRIMSLSRAAAASISSVGHYHATKLSDLSIPFKFLPPTVALAVGDDFPSDSLAARINEDSIFALNQRLEDFRTRYTYSDSIQAARDWIAQKFRDWGYTDVTTPRFYLGGWHYNVRAVKPGAVKPDEVIVIGGHYDSWTNSQQTPGPYQYAPGADDDGSGTALTMELARVLADVPLRKTVIFMPFDAEEIGLVGSSYAASTFAANGTKLEVMYNFDMVGFTNNNFWDFDFSSGDVYAYRNISVATANRVSNLIPIITSPGGGSDHVSFDQYGFNIVNHIESDFNTLGWHTNLDVTTRMNFPYMTHVARTAVVSLAIVADAAYPAEVGPVVDIGDGQSLEVAWSDCSSDCSYTIYWGTEPAVYADSALLPVGQCDYTITGLEDGTTYYILAVGESPNGYRAAYGVEGSGTPYKFPRAVQNLVGTVTANQLRLSISWDPGGELDLSHYNVYRRLGRVGVFSLFVEGLSNPFFTDTEVVPHVGYEYYVTAVDVDGNESTASEGVMLFPATFDGGPVVADGFTKDHTYDPDQDWQEAWLDSLLGGYGFGLVSSDEFGGPVTLADIGQYSSLFWIDDDVIIKNIGASEAALNEYASQNTNMLISGYRTFIGWSPKLVPTDHLLYREFGLSYYNYTAQFDFIGAHGQNGWPSVQVDGTRGTNEWRDIPKLSPRPGATVIGTFDSFWDFQDWEGEPVGLAYETSNGKRVLLSFPLYYLTPESAQALLAKVIEYFGVTGPYDKGDLDHSGTIDIADLALLLDHLFISLQPLPDPEAADMDGRAGVSIGDVYHLINYLFLGGPLPIPSQ